MDNIATTSKQLAGQIKKSSLWLSALYTFFVSLLAVALCFAYFSIFSSSFYLKSFSGKYLVGVVDTTTYNCTKPGDVLQFEKYASIKNLKPGDEIFYSGNLGDGVGIVQKIYLSEGYVTIAINDNLQNISTSTIIGKVVHKTAFWGYVLWFFQSIAGVITFNVLLVLVIVLRLALSVHIETTKKGKQLKISLKIQERTSKNLKNIKKRYTSTGLDVDSFDMLAGEFSQNKIKIAEYAKKNDLPNAYRYLLFKVHRVYIAKQKLSVIDRSKITNCIELMCMVDKFDMDAEYMLTDLILRTEVIWFDIQNFADSVRVFLNNNNRTIEEINNLLMVFYVLIKKNKGLQNREIYSLLQEIENFLVQKKLNKTHKDVVNLVNFVKNLIKI